MIEENAADRLEDAPHPRERFALIGHGAAERALIEAYRGGRMHHAWLIGGPEGIGKATLAYRFARFVLANPDPSAVAQDSLAVDPDHPAARRIVAGSHPNLLALRRIAEAGKDRVPQDIAIGAVRELGRFFGATAGESGWRICIVDAADELNRSSANALLKMLEEPPARALFLIVAHMPGRLLPTIRSRCRTLLLDPLSESAVAEALRSLPDRSFAPGEAEALAARAEGSVRRALEWAGEEAADLAARVGAELARLPSPDPAALHAIGDRLARRDDRAFDLFLRLVTGHLHAELCARGGEGARRLAPLAEVWDKVEAAAAQVRTFNLERKPFVFQVFGWLAEAGRRQT